MWVVGCQQGPRVERSIWGLVLLCHCLLGVFGSTLLPLCVCFPFSEWKLVLYSSVGARIDTGGISTMLLNAENAIFSFVSFVESVDPDPEVKQPSPIVGCCRFFCVYIVYICVSLPIPKIQLSVLQKE